MSAARKVWAFAALVFSALVIEAARAQTAGCYQIDRFGELCIPVSTIFVENAHDGYEKWMQPHRPTVSCCNKQDCEPVEARYDEKRGTYQAYIEGEWRDIPAMIILDTKKPENINPDGSFHACWNRSTKELLCFREAEPKI
jgi:hypothetical protein